MKVREFITKEIDVDVYDNVCEELAIAFCGPVKLTDEGEEYFEEVLDYDVAVVKNARQAVAVIDVNYVDWRRRLRKAKELFESMAGYCTVSEFDKWFQQ